MSKIKQKLKQARQDAKLSQTGLAKQLGYNAASTISRMESNELVLDLDLAIEWCEKCNTTLKKLLD